MHKSKIFFVIRKWWCRWWKTYNCSTTTFTSMEQSPKTDRMTVGSAAGHQGPKLVGLSPLRELTNISTPATERPFRVSVEGNIGAGKSTLIRYFERFPAIETYPEPIESWRNVRGHNILDLLYSDPSRYAAPFQSYVQLSRLRIQASRPSRPGVRVQMFERSLQNNRYCFVECLRAAGRLHEVEYAVLDEWYQWIAGMAPIDLDLIVYLRSSPSVVYERVRQRARPEENHITLDYLERLHHSHEQWLMMGDDVDAGGTASSSDVAKGAPSPPVLVLDADRTLEEVHQQMQANEDTILGLRHNDARVMTSPQIVDAKKVLDF